MKRNDLEKKIVNEANRIVPNKINQIYERLGISFIDEKIDASLEKQIAKEGNTIMKNVRRPKIVSKNDEWSSFYEKKIASEKKQFIPDVKAKIGIKKANPLLAFFKNPGFIAGFSTASIAIICSSIIIANNLNKIIDTPDTSSSINSTTTVIDDSTSVDEVIELKGKSTINFKVTSASESYKPEVVYSVNTTGYIDNGSIVSANDASANILNDFDSDEVTKLDSNKQYTIPTFTGNYLKSALNLGYLERKDASKANVITLKINAGKEDEQYYETMKKNLESSINEFMYENKVIAKFEIVAETSATEDDEKTQLIRQAYQICITLFVDSNGEVNKVLCFSTNFEDWLVKYADYSIDDLQEYVDTLLYISSMISNDSNKDQFINSLADCVSMQEKIYQLNDRYKKLSDLYEDVLDKLEGDDDHDEDEDFVKPDDKDGYDWDWWDDVGHNHGHGDKPRKSKYHDDYYGGNWIEPSDENYETFINDIDTFLTDNQNIDSKTIDELYSLCPQIRDYSRQIYDFYFYYEDEVNRKMNDILISLDNGEYNHGHPDDDRPDNDCPPDWDDDFDDWWGHHHH